MQRGCTTSHIRQSSSGCGSCDFICMHKIMHGKLDFPCDSGFAAPTRIWLRCYTFKIHQQRCKTRHRQHVFSVRVVPYWNKLPEEIVNAPSVDTINLRLDARVELGCCVLLKTPATSRSPEIRMARWPKTPCYWKSLLAQRACAG